MLGAPSLQGRAGRTINRICEQAEDGSRSQTRLPTRFAEFPHLQITGVRLVKDVDNVSWQPDLQAAKTSRRACYVLSARPGQ